jgi:tripartite ATP-independent transporter DctM subunit
MNAIWPTALFLTAFLLIFLGYPVAFSLGGTALLFALIGDWAGVFSWNLLQAIPMRVFGIMSNQVLLAVPYFVFMGAVLERSRLAEDLLSACGSLLGNRRGGLAIAVIVVGTLLAAATGVVGASVVSMGMISLPVMLAAGYNRSLACGVITAAGSLGQIIPPSVVLVVLADQMGVSVGDLFRGALLPGLMLAGLYILLLSAIALFAPHMLPALPAKSNDNPPGAWQAWRKLGSLLAAMLPTSALILIVLGSIFTGLATPTEAGALGSIGAILLAAGRRRISRSQLRQALESTTRLTVMVMFLLVGSTAFALVFRGFDGDLMLEGMLTALPGGRVSFLLAANAIVFLLGFFIDFFEIAFIVVPLLMPAARALGIDPIWFAIMLGLNIQTSFLTPPFGFALFYLRGVAPSGVSTGDIYRGSLPFVSVQLLGLALLAAFPQLARL